MKADSKMYLLNDKRALIKFQIDHGKAIEDCDARGWSDSLSIVTK